MFNIYITLFLILVLMLYLFEVIVPFALAFIVAYIVSPLNNWLGNYLNKTVASLLSILCFIISISFVLVLISPVIIKQLQNFISMIPLYSSKIEILLNQFNSDYLLKEKLESEYYINFLKPFSKNLISAGNEIINNGILFFNSLLNIVLVLVISFYMTLELQKVKSFLFLVAKKANFYDFPKLMEEIDVVLSRFIRGQGLVCLILSVFYSITLYLIDINFGILLGLFAGLISFIPYVGAFLGGGLALILGFSQFGFSNELLFLLVIFISGQLIESYYLTPKFVGNAIKLNAMWIIFSLLTGAHLAGFIGILISLPVAAIVGVLVRHYFNKIFEKK
ncbi:AI-2E family transporter [bacterium]|nr:AI-2E family transporter [bacterium]